MKLLINHGRIIATATDDYTGPDAFIAAPDSFDLQQIDSYVFIDGVLQLPKIDQREVAKSQRQAAVEKIIVTTAAGHRFDGDETSQNRMARAIVALQATGTTSVMWVLADNTAIDASAAELSEALALAGAAQAAIWVLS